MAQYRYLARHLEEDMEQPWDEQMYRQGMDDRRAGKSIFSCPRQGLVGRWEAQSWKAGWCDADMALLSEAQTLAAKIVTQLLAARDTYNGAGQYVDDFRRIVEENISPVVRQRDELLAALTHLTNEVRANLGMAGEEILHIVGNTNMGCLQRRTAEAYTLLAALAEKPLPDKDEPKGGE
jgi:hypothetical protein